MALTEARAASVTAASVASAAMLDAAFVLVFVLIGRASHEEDLLGALQTWWPFLGGLAIGWFVMRAWRTPQRVVWTGVGVWAVAVAGGMLLRVASGQGVQLSFVIVTALTLGVFLLGWRGVAALVRRGSRLRKSPSAS